MTGSPMAEVLGAHRDAIGASSALGPVGVEPGKYFLLSAHREENVDAPERLAALLGCLNAVAAEWGLPVLVSTHPRPRKRLEALVGVEIDPLVRFHEPFGFLDYNRLQLGALGVLPLGDDRGGVDHPGLPGRDVAFVDRAAGGSGHGCDHHD